MKANASQANQVLQYFALLFAITIPFWLFGGSPLPLPVNLPISALSFVNPLIAAAILSYRQDRFEGIKELVQKTFDFGQIRNKTWYVPILFLVPFIYFLAYWVMRLAGMPLPEPEISYALIPFFFLLYFVTATGEELGWSGYALDPMQQRWGALAASIMIGVVWQVWHIIPHLQQSHPFDWIMWQSLYSVALRILMVWIYNNTGRSVFATIVVHAMDNVSWSLFPNYGSHHNPFMTAIVGYLVVFIVLVVWEPKTFRRRA